MMIKIGTFILEHVSEIIADTTVYINLHNEIIILPFLSNWPF